MNIKKIKKEIKNDQKNYIGKKKIIYKLSNHQNYVYYSAIKYNRLYRYYKANHKNIIGKILFFYYTKKKNKFCNKYSIELNGAEMGTDIIIFHNNIIINEKSKIGNNCKLHGNNCIGNNGIDNKCPVIGDNVNIGYGAVIIGNVKINNNIIIGANSVVTKDLLESNSIYAGCPAKLIKK